MIMRVFVSILLVLLFMSFHSGHEESAIIGNWAMFKDRHPDGWGSFKPPYEYLILSENGDYTRAYIQDKGDWIFFGKYELLDDALIVFSESIGTDGKDKVALVTDTSKVHMIENGILELHEDWYTMLRKREKKWRHRKKYRRLTDEEQKELGNAIFKVMEGYSKMGASKDGVLESDSI